MYSKKNSRIYEEPTKSLEILKGRLIRDADIKRKDQYQNLERLFRNLERKIKEEVRSDFFDDLHMFPF